mmetsp:Transcript_10886/g.23225  ORF Transcript_10886/g.23225 Transcript_10886/m.23225 type:complete len:250 (+) Transcript_10886:206-955(+)
MERKLAPCRRTLHSVGVSAQAYERDCRTCSAPSVRAHRGSLGNPFQTPNIRRVLRVSVPRPLPEFCTLRSRRAEERLLRSSLQRTTIRSLPQNSALVRCGALQRGTEKEMLHLGLVSAGPFHSGRTQRRSFVPCDRPSASVSAAHRQRLSSAQRTPCRRRHRQRPQCQRRRDQAGETRPSEAQTVPWRHRSRTAKFPVEPQGETRLGPGENTCGSLQTRRSFRRQQRFCPLACTEPRTLAPRRETCFES